MNIYSNDNSHGSDNNDVCTNFHFLRKMLQTQGYSKYYHVGHKLDCEEYGPDNTDGPEPSGEQMPSKRGHNLQEYVQRKTHFQLIFCPEFSLTLTGSWVCQYSSCRNLRKRRMNNFQRTVPFVIDIYRFT